MRLRSWGSSGCAVLALGVLGCARDVSAPDAAQPPGGAGGSGPISCEATAAGPAPLRLLSRFQYDNAVRDLLGDTDNPSAAFPPENEVDGYRTNAAANLANSRLVESYLAAAEAVATRAAAPERLAQVAPCAEGADPIACGHDFVASFGARAFRRPLSEAELTPLTALFDAGSAQGFAKGIELVVQAVLQSPQFLYRVDALKSATPESGAVALAGYELAGRLAFTLWGSVPDAELLAAAGEGRLVTAGDVEREARRLLDDPRAGDIVRDFSEQWLGLSRLDGAVREGSELEPGVLSAALRQSLTHYLHDSYFGPDGSFQKLFSAPSVYLNAELAPLYGVTGPAGGFQARTLAEPRFGLLTQPGLLALLSHSEQTAPVIRGVFVRERILCLEVPPPPPDVNVVPPDPDPNATTRERFRQHTEQATCSSCHQLIDGIGFGFERYDQLGRYREVENGLAVDESGQLLGTEEMGLDGPFAGAAELIARIATSSRARDCLATNWYRYSFGRHEQPEDVCSLDQLKARFRSSNGDLKELLVGLTQTDSFLYRPAILETP